MIGMRHADIHVLYSSKFGQFINSALSKFDPFELIDLAETFSAETACRTTELTENAGRSIVQRHANQLRTYVVRNWFGMSFYRTTWIFSCVYMSFYRTTCPNS